MNIYKQASYADAPRCNKLECVTKAQGDGRLGDGVVEITVLFFAANCGTNFTKLYVCVYDNDCSLQRSFLIVDALLLSGLVIN